MGEKGTAAASTVIPHLAKAPRLIPPAYLDRALTMLTQAETGEVQVFAWCACGPQFATWYAISPTSRDMRMNLIGQLQMMIRELEDVEIEQTEIGK